MRSRYVRQVGHCRQPSWWRPGLLLAVLAAVALHLGLAWQVRPPAGVPAGRPVPGALATRMIVPPAPLPEAPPPSMTSRGHPAPGHARADGPHRPKAPAPAAVAVPASWAVPVAQDRAGEIGPAPRYRTRVPGPFRLSYRLSRGGLHGQGDLVWGLADGRYELRLSGEIALIGRVLTQVSTGALDGHGLAPVRFTDQRRGRAAQAVNFQRAAGKISFSGPATEYPLVDGVQDRLSWMVQLAAIAEADPAQVAEGGRVTLLVAGPRGDLDPWTFIGQGAEPVAVGDRTVQAPKLARAPRRPHDTGVEVWLDPGRQHLPVRARFVDGGRESFVLQLQP